MRRERVSAELGTDAPCTGRMSRFDSDLTLSHFLNTIQSCANSVRQFLLFLEDQGCTSLALASAATVPAFFHHLLATYRPTSIRTVASNIRSFLRFCKDDRLLSAVPSRCVRNRPIIPILSDQETDALEKLLQGGLLSFRDKAIILLALRTGLRSVDILCESAGKVTPGRRSKGPPSLGLRVTLYSGASFESSYGGRWESCHSSASASPERSIKVRNRCRDGGHKDGGSAVVQAAVEVTVGVAAVEQRVARGCERRASGQPARLRVECRPRDVDKPAGGGRTGNC